jgi:hypothetical protein
LIKELSAKLGGVNQFVSLMRASTLPPTRSDIFMFFGIDYTHTTCSGERPSMLLLLDQKIQHRAGQLSRKKRINSIQFVEEKFQLNSVSSKNFLRINSIQFIDPENFWQFN